MIEVVVKKPFLKPSKAHGKANARALTGTETAEREANLAEVAAQKALRLAERAPEGSP
jgi:hypothetical protein